MNLTMKQVAALKELVARTFANYGGNPTTKSLTLTIDELENLCEMAVHTALAARL
jgi:hypothetical protein